MQYRWLLAFLMGLVILPDLAMTKSKSKSNSSRGKKIAHHSNSPPVEDRSPWEPAIGAFAERLKKLLPPEKLEAHLRSTKNTKNIEYQMKCANLQFTQHDEEIRHCLEKIVIKNENFTDKLLRVLNNRGTIRKCATYVKNALFQSGMTESPPIGCTGYEKIQYILNSDPSGSFVDITDNLAQMMNADKPLKGRPSTDLVFIKAAKLAPTGALLSFRGGDSDTCAKRFYPGIGHFTAKANSELFCHFTCDICPAVPGRTADRIVIKMSSIYLERLALLKNDLGQLCNQLRFEENTMANDENHDLEVGRAKTGPM